jgi:hypothetical protein
MDTDESAAAAAMTGHRSVPSMAGWSWGGQSNAKIQQMRYSNGMDHLEVLREKVTRLRSEIADIQRLNEVYRLQGTNKTEAQIAHGQRLERLQQIQEELFQLSNLSQKVVSVEQMKERHRSRLHLVKRAS